MRTEKESSPQISGDMVSLHNMVSPQNGDTRGGPPPSLRHLCCTTGTYIITVPLVSTRLSKTKLCFVEGRDSRGKLQRLPLPCSFTSHYEAFFTLESTKKLWKLKPCSTARNFFMACYCILVIAFCVTYCFPVFNSYVCSFNFADFLHQIATEDFSYWGQNWNFFIEKFALMF